MGRRLKTDCIYELTSRGRLCRVNNLIRILMTRLQHVVQDAFVFKEIL